MKKTFATIILGALLTLATFLTASGGSEAKEYLLVGGKPNKLFLIDVRGRKVERSYTIPGPGDAPWTITVAPGGNVAYVLTNRLGSVSGINLDTGKEVFRADLSSANERVKDFVAMEVSPDGKEIFAYEIPIQLLPGEYRVLDTRISVFRADAGLKAKPIRRFKVPRRISLLVFSTDGRDLYGLGWDIYRMDPQTGEIRETYPIQNSARPNHAPAPDAMNFWPHWEQSKVLATLVYGTRTDIDPEDPAAYRTALHTLDLRTGEARLEDFEITEHIMYSAIISPTKPEAFAVNKTLAKIDLKTYRTVKRVDLDHTYYAMNISKDGEELYLGQTLCDIAVYAAADLGKLASIELHGCPDMVISSLRMIER